MDFPENFPYGCGETEILSVLRDYADEIIASHGNVNKVLQLAPLIVIGHTELQSRQTARITRISVGLGILSLVIAVVALWVSVTNSRTDAHWQTSQLELLQIIERDLQLSRDSQLAVLELLNNIDGNVHKVANERNLTLSPKK